MPQDVAAASHRGTARRRALSLTLALELMLVVLAGALVWQSDAGDERPRATNLVDLNLAPAAPSAPAAPAVPGAATGTYTWDCGRNENGHRNTANIVMAPGFPGQPHHVHDYVGNVSTAVGSTPQTLADARTTCRNGDLSTYFWPVLRILDPAATDDHTGHDGQIQVPVEVRLVFSGNPRGNVVPMPPLLAGTVGDAVAVTNGGRNAAATWTCSGTTDRRTTAYPRCPAGEQVQRVYDFPSCWDGRRADSKSHRAHLAFPSPDGSCPRNTFPVPRLRLTLGYDIQPAAAFQIDAFDGQRNSPLTDHAFFVNLMPQPLMATVVDCLNSGRTCRD
ncbi:DUF1996 domain-containing protein [Plantactinospora sp. WMMB334]|uniref:DUF1996 domain-containing protein n=1 Tax=Plantactinospora sp. WMMB334 TaxID=3404119 RepID=UPI003B94C832